MHRVVTLLVMTAAFGCAYRVADVPTVHSLPPTGDRVFVLANVQGRDTSDWINAGRLATDLEAAGFIPSIVTDEEGIPEGAPVLQISSEGRSCFSEPMLTVLTVGVIPHFGCEAYGHNVLVRKTKDSTPAEVDASFRVRYMAGWITWPAVFSRNYVSKDPREIARIYEVNLLREAVKAALR